MTRNLMLQLENFRYVPSASDGTVQQIVDQYLDKPYTIIGPDQIPEESVVRSVEFLEDIRIPWKEISLSVQKVYKKPPLEPGSPFRAQVTMHYPQDDLVTYLDYEPGMFDPY